MGKYIGKMPKEKCRGVGFKIHPASLYELRRDKSAVAVGFLLRMKLRRTRWRGKRLKIHPTSLFELRRTRDPKFMLLIREPARRYFQPLCAKLGKLAFTAVKGTTLPPRINVFPANPARDSTYRIHDNRCLP